MSNANGAEPDMDATVELVTPKKALAWLENAAKNRNITDSVVRRYGADMLAGHWRLNGQGIIFDINGQLVDGRHRLTAIVATGCEVPLLVVRGAKPEAFETMDSGRGRTLANTLTIEGLKNSAATAATARLCWAFIAGTNLKYSPSRSDLLHLIRLHPYIETCVANVANRDGFTKPMGVPKTALSALLVLANDERKHDDKIDAFLHGFVTGENLAQGDARLTLRRWLARMRQEAGVGGTRIAEPFFAAATKAWSAFVADHELTQIRLPVLFNSATLSIDGFERSRWFEVPDLSRYSFAALGPEFERQLANDAKTRVQQYRASAETTVARAKKDDPPSTKP